MRAPHPTLDRLDRIGWSLAAGVMLALSYPPAGLYPLAWVALVPLIVRWARAHRSAHLAAEVYAAFLIVAAVTGGGAVLHPYADQALFAGLGLLVLPLPFALAFGLAGVVRARLGLVVGTASLVANLLAAEAISGFGLAGLPWLALGHTQADATLFISIAEIGGVGILSLWVILVNVLFFAAACARPRPGFVPGPRSLALLLALAVLVAPAAYGDQRQPVAPRHMMDVAVVQPGTPAATWGAISDGARVDTMARLSDALLASAPAPPRLLVWPEGSVPLLGDAGREERLYDRLGVWARGRGTYLLAGAYTTGRSAPSGASAGDGYRSAAILFGRGEAQAYERMHLMPLVERVPLLGRENIPAEALAPPGETPSYAAGDHRRLLDAGGIRVAAPLGMETLQGAHVAALVADGADVIIAPAQTGWWAPAPLASQHLRLTRLRAVETGRAVLLATVSGPSALVTPDGAIRLLGGESQRATFFVEVPLYLGTSPYVQHGDFIWHGGLLVSGLLTIVGLAAAAARRSAPRRRPAPAGAARLVGA